MIHDIRGIGFFCFDCGLEVRWCGCADVYRLGSYVPHCRTLHIVHFRLGKIKMDNHINRPLSERFDVRLFPAINIFRNGVLLSDYSRRREARVLARSLLHAKMEQVSAQCCFGRRRDHAHTAYPTNERQGLSIARARCKQRTIGFGAVEEGMGDKSKQIDSTR